MVIKTLILNILKITHFTQNKWLEFKTSCSGEMQNLIFFFYYCLHGLDQLSQLHSIDQRAIVHGVDQLW